MPFDRGFRAVCLFVFGSFQRESKPFGECLLSESGLGLAHSHGLNCIARRKGRKTGMLQGLIDCLHFDFEGICML